MSRSQHTDLREARYTKLLGWVLWLFIRLLSATLRFRIHYATEEEKNTAGKQQRIFTLWHNRTLTPCYAYRYLIKPRPSVPMCMITSASKDGALLTRVAELFGMRTLRGSRNRRAVAVFIGMCKEVKRGASMCIAPDGPKGPLYGMTAGCVRLAAVTGVPIVGLSMNFSSYWRINKAWDKFIIPKPFSRVDIYWSAPIHVPKDISEEEHQDYEQQVAEAISLGAPDFLPKASQ